METENNMLLRYIHNITLEMRRWSDGPKYILVLDSEPEMLVQLSKVFGDKCKTGTKEELMDWFKSYQKTSATAEFIFLNEEMAYEATSIRNDMVITFLKRGENSWN